LLFALARSTCARRDTALIAGIAVLGRGMVVTLYAHFAMLAVHWSVAAASAVLAGLTGTFVLAAFEVVRTGSQDNLVVTNSATYGHFCDHDGVLDTEPAVP